METLVKYKKYIPFIVCLAIVLFLSTYKLTESPPIWMDEGIITQVSRNVVESNKYAFQIAPQEFVSAGFVTTSYPVTGPIALSYKIFGIGLIQGRGVMVLFIIGTFLALYYFARQQFPDKKIHFATVLLMITFAPLYGHGKNVLGEVPGLMFLILALIFVYKIESGKNARVNFGLVGLFLGLCVVTKPIYIIVCPAFLIMAILLRKQGGWKEWLTTAVGFIIPTTVWFSVQFSGDTAASIISLYSNPHSTDVVTSIQQNIKRFFTEAQPFYFVLSFVVWLGSVIIRYIKKIKISVVETGAFVFTTLLLLAYTKTIGYYRYFFPAQILALFYLTHSLAVLSCHKFQRWVLDTAVTILVIFQLYQTSSNSWVSTHYASTQTAVLENAIATLPKNFHIYVYQAPEVVIFLPHKDYSQYIEVTKTIVLGYDTLSEVAEGVTPFIITNADTFEKNQPTFAKYKVKKNAGKYIILSRK